MLPRNVAIKISFMSMYGWEIEQFHQGECSVCKLNIVLVSTVDVNPGHVPNHCCLKIATAQPTMHFRWWVIHIAVKFKNCLIKQLHACYTSKYSRHKTKPRYCLQASLDNNKAKIVFLASSSEWITLICQIINDSYIGQSGSHWVEELSFTISESTTLSCSNQKWKTT